MLFQKGEKVKCKETEIIGFVEEKEWENGWRYTILSVNHVYFYREEHEITSA